MRTLPNQALHHDKDLQDGQHFLPSMKNKASWRRGRKQRMRAGFHLNNNGRETQYTGHSQTMNKAPKA